MINRVVEYFKLPHPLKRGKSIAVSDPDELAGALSQIRADDRKSDGPARIPRFLRVLISADNISKAEGERLVNIFESQSQRVHRLLFDWAKLKIFLCLALTGCLSCFLFWSIFNFHIVWVPGEWIINTFLGGNSNWWIFYGAVIAVPPVSFLITYFFGGQYWSRINDYSKYTELFSEMGKDRRKEIKKYTKKNLEILAEIAKQEKADVGRVQILVDEILSTTNAGADFIKDWTEKFDEVLEDLSCNLPDSLRGEITKLQDLKEDLLELLRQGFRFMPLVVVNPNSADVSRTDINLSILLSGFKNKAKNLKKFLEEAEPLQKEVWTNLELLDKARGKSERVEILENIQVCFERMRNIASGFHFGVNLCMPHERGRNIADFYDKFYEMFGRAKFDILEGKRAARALIFSKLPVETRSQQKRRISRLKLLTERLLGQEIEHSKFYDSISHAFAWWGATLARSVAVLLILMSCFVSLFSFEILAPDEVLVTRSLRMGVKEKATQEERVILRDLDFSYPDEGFPVGFGKSLFWHLPMPLTWAHKVEFKSEKEFRAYRILAGTGPRTLWQKGKGLLAGAYGGDYYEVLEIDFKFKIKDRLAWTNIDYDGRGLDRLSRDITSILDEWQGTLFNFYEESFLIDIKDEKEREKIFSGSYFEKLSRDGTLKTIIQRQIAQSPYFAYQYGTVMERISPGIESVLSDLKSREARIKAGFIDVEDKELELEKIEQFKIWVEEYKDKIEEMTEKEFSTLRKNPKLLKKMLEDPRANIGELKNFEMVWAGIQQTIFHQYATDKLKKILNGELGEKKREELLGRIKKRISEDSYFGNLVEIVNIETRIFFMPAMEYGQKIQRKMMELGELT